MYKRSPFAIFKSVVMALFLREVQTRFGTKRLGYFWAIFDPLLMVLVFAGLKSAIADSTMPGVEFPVFLATGFLAFFLWKDIVNRSMDAFSANSALFSYKQVKPFDTIVARFMLELLVSILATCVLIFLGWYIGLDMQVENFSMVVLAVAWLCVFGFGLGLMGAVFNSFYETYGRIVHVLMTPLLFVSALMYTVDSLPPVLREIVLYNPLVHFIEMIHGNYFYALNTEYVDYQYMTYWTLFPLFIGLYFYTRSEKKILSS